MNAAAQQKTIWLTGASSGIGLALCELLLANGFRVIATVRKVSALASLEAGYPGSLFVIKCDFQQSGEIEQLPQAIAEHVDHLDGIILSAGVCEYINDAAIDMPLLRRVMEINFFAAAHCCQIALPFLKSATCQQDNHKPFILAVSSLSTVTAFSRAEAYGASKCALRYFLESLRIDLYPDIDVCIVSPGFVDTPLTAKNDFSMPFMITAEQAAAKIMKVIYKRQLHSVFPRRLAWMLKLVSFVPGLWFRLMAPKLRKPISV